MKKILIHAITVVFLAWAATTAAAGEKIVLKIGHDSPTSHPFQIGFVKFKEVLEAETKGAVEVLIYPDAQLGDEAQIIQGIRLGTIDGGESSTGALAPFVPEADLFNLPFVFRDQPHMYKVLDGPIGQRVGKAIEAKTNSILLGWYSTGFPSLYNSKRPIRTLADIKGLKMRVMASPIQIDTINALGAQGISMSFGELYNALQQGVVDGANHDPVDMVAMKFYEVTKYVSLTYHFGIANAFLFSKKRYDALPPNIQQAVLKAGKASTSVARGALEKDEVTAIEVLKQKGLHFNTVDQKPFRDAVQPVYRKYAERVGGMKAIEEFANY